MLKDIGPWIAGRMKMEKVTQEEMSICLGITQQALSQKLRRCQFTYYDLIVILKRLRVTDEEIIKLMKAYEV